MDGMLKRAINLERVTLCFFLFDIMKDTIYFILWSKYQFFAKSWSENNEKY